ncbi:MAG: hypothetical protein RL497_1706 [Pseudomonadota bacterium]
MGRTLFWDDKNHMHLKKLTPSFYKENTHLQQALDNTNGSWERGKIRGYGVVIIKLGDLMFAIPLRSNIKHGAAYITVKSNAKGAKGKGLDFSKALLITQDNFLSEIPFKIPPEEHKKLQNKEHFITEKFEKYVDKYVLAVRKADQNILNSTEYRFTTLINYHLELGIK